MLPPNLCPGYYMFLLSVSKNSYAGSVAELSAIAEISRVGSWQPEHWSVVEVWQEVGCQISNRSLFCWNRAPGVSCISAGRRSFFFDRIIVISWVGDLVLSRIHIWRYCNFERGRGLGRPRLCTIRCRIGDDPC